jgi:hypothetical protein
LLEKAPARTRPFDAVGINNIGNPQKPLPEVEDARVVAECEAQVAVFAGMGDGYPVEF